MAINFDKVPRYIRNEIDAPRRPVAQGSKNKTVQRIQEWLNFHECRTGIDSDFGPATASCVKDFQRKNRLAVNGKVNSLTWKALVAPVKQALKKPYVSRSSSQAAVVKSIASQHVDQHPIEIGAPNEGPWVRLYCEGNEGRHWAWCAGFVTLIMQQAYFYRNIKAPIKGSVSCDSLAAQAKEAGLFVPGKAIARGDISWSSLGECCIFLRRRTATDWTHTGIAMDATGPHDALVFSTIEGNTNDEGSREGYEACRRKRGLGSGGYDFIRFTKDE